MPYLEIALLAMTTLPMTVVFDRGVLLEVSQPSFYHQQNIYTEYV